MGFFKKNKHNIEEEQTAAINTEPIPAADEDDFDEAEKSVEISREDFRKMADENLIAAIEEGTVSDTAASTEDGAEDDTATEEAPIPESDIDTATETDDSVNSEDNIEEAEDTESPESVSEDEDDFDFSAETEASKVTDIEIDLPDREPEKEKKPRMTFAEFRILHRKGLITATAIAGTIFALCLGLYIYGCATVPRDVMGRNIYIEDVNVSGLTYEDALDKVKATTLLDDRNITVTCKTQTYTINGFDVGLTAQVEETVDKAMRYGKTGNVLIDGFANALQVIHRHTVMPSADVNELILRTKLAEFGKQLHGELVEHKLEVGDGVIICTPGHTGFSGNTDTAYEQVVKAIANEDFSRIRVSLNAAPPKTLTEKDIDAFAYKNPQDATFAYVDGNVTVVPEEWGRYLNIEETKTYVPQLYEGGPIIKIPFYSSEPAVKADELNQKLFNTVLGTFKTGYGGSTGNRAANVANAAAKINNKILAPGEVFSFNETVGKRTTANGFFTAPEYANGQTVMGIGGGTCQVSSTLYNAVLLADLSIVYRLNHMFPVGYCPIGRDATVTDSGIDFKFENNTAYPIKITSTTGGGIVTVNIIGTARDIPHIVTFTNTSSYSGSNHVVRTYRHVHDPNGNLIRKDDLGSSTYMPH